MIERQAVLTTAMAHHQAGQLALAERYCRVLLQSNPNDSDSLHLLGVIAHQAGRHDSAVDLISRALPVLGKVAAVHANLGNAYRALNRLDQARVCLDEALRLDPSSADAHAFLGQIFFQQGKLSEALQSLQQSLRFNPSLLIAHRTLGSVLAAQKRIPEAIEALQHAIRLAPSAPDIHVALAELLASTRPEEAIVCYREALRISPNYFAAFKKLGVLLLQMNKPHESEEVYEEALRYHPDDFDFHNNLGVALNAQGKKVEAVVHFQAALRLKPDFAEAMNNLGAVCLQQSKFREALKHFENALKYRSDYVQAALNRGEVLSRMGRNEEALSQLNTINAQYPHLAESHWLASEVLRQLGDHDGAVRRNQYALGLNPKLAQRNQRTPVRVSRPLQPNYRPNNFSIEWNNRGVTLRNEGKYAEALMAFDQAIQFDPQFALPHVNRAAALIQLGQRDEAVLAYETVLQLDPNNSVIHLQLGVLQKQFNNNHRSVYHFAEAVRIDPMQADAHNNLGAIAMEQRNFSEAMEHYQRALMCNPDFAEAHNNLGALYRERDNPEEAMGHFWEAIRLRPDYPEARTNLAVVLMEEGRLQEAIDSYLDALRLRPDFAEAENNLAYLYTELGRPEDALKHSLRAIELRPTFGEVYSNLADLMRQGRYTFTPDQVQFMEKMTTGVNRLSPEDAAPFHFAVATLCEHQKKHDQAFRHYVLGNRLKQQQFANQNRVFNHEHCKTMFDNIISTFTADRFAQMTPPGLDSELPVFVVGMPRSGTTLVEQILASHPDVHGAGELKQIQRMVLRLSRRDKEERKLTLDVTPPHMRRLSQNHLDYLHRLAPNAKRVVDKMPDNFAHLEFIYTLFPHARVIHCRRDPIDTCLSCFVQNFRSITFATNFEDLAFYYQQYERLMDHWRKVIPLRMYEVVYEELVENQEAISRELISFLGLEWNERCLEFHKTDRPVQTASKLQVRQPIYKTSMKRWKRYGDQLRPLIHSLNYTDDWGKDLKSGEVIRG